MNESNVMIDSPLNEQSMSTQKQQSPKPLKQKRTVSKDN